MTKVYTRKFISQNIETLFGNLQHFNRNFKQIWDENGVRFCLYQHASNPYMVVLAPKDEGRLEVYVSSQNEKFNEEFSRDFAQSVEIELTPDTELGQTREILEYAYSCFGDYRIQDGQNKVEEAEKELKLL